MNTNWFVVKAPVFFSCRHSACDHEVGAEFTDIWEGAIKTVSGPRNVSPYLTTGCWFKERTGNGTWDNTHSHADTDMSLASRSRLGIPLSVRLLHSSQVSGPPTPLVRHDTLTSLLEGLPAAGVMSAHQNHVQQSCFLWLLPPTQRPFLFSVSWLQTFIVTLTSFGTLDLLCSPRQHISLTVNTLLGVSFSSWLLSFYLLYLTYSQ